MSVEVVAIPTYDSYNSDPEGVTFAESHSGGVNIRLRDGRSFTIAKGDWSQIVTVFPSTNGADP